MSWQVNAIHGHGSDPRSGANREDTIETTGEIDYGLWIRPSFMVKGECP